MGRPVGKRIIEVCCAVESFGVCSSGDVMDVMEISDLSNVIKYLSRSVGLGLLTVSRASRPHQFCVVAGWRQKIKPIARVQPYVVRPAKRGAKSDFALGSVWGCAA